jgi:hypothetical protein
LPRGQLLLSLLTSHSGAIFLWYPASSISAIFIAIELSPGKGV